MNKKQKTKQPQDTSTKRTQKLRVARETVKTLDDDDLRHVAGGGQMSQGWIEC